MKRIFLLLTCALIFFSGCDLLNSPTMKEITLQTEKEKIKLIVEIADTKEKREKGLMYRQKLENGKGMWFVFEDEKPRNFWMKNTLIPLDIVFCNGKKEIVHIIENVAPCGDESCMIYPSGKPARFVLELPTGFVEAHSIKEGDKVI